MEYEDDLSQDIAAAISATTEPPAADAGVAPPAEGASSLPEEKPSAGERARDEQGRFANKETAKPAAGDNKQPAATETEPPAQQKASQPDLAKAPATSPPPNWKGNGKVSWQLLPAHVQQEIAADYQRFSQVETSHQRLKAAIGPEREQILAAQYGSVEQGVQNLFAISDLATKNPLGFIQWFAQQRGIDISQIAGQGQGQGQSPSQEPNPAMQEVGQLRSTIQQLQQQISQMQNAPVQAEIQSIERDPAFPHFNELRPHMKALIESGAVQGTGRQLLEEAYRAASMARPDLREQFIQQELEKRTQANAALVANKKQVAGSITGSPAGAKVPDDDPDLDLEGIIRRNVERAFAA